MEQLNKGTKAAKAAEHMTEVGRCCRKTDLGTTVYGLFRENLESDSFLIRAESEEMCEEGTIKGSLSQVSLLFERIADGEVPPYILPEILEDHAKEMLYTL